MVWAARSDLIRSASASIVDSASASGGGETRKYRLSLIVANQYVAQLDESTLHALFGNLGTLIAFQAGVKDNSARR